MAKKTYKQIKAIQNSYKDKIKKLCPEIDEQPGIYFLLRTDENGIDYFYIGQAVKLLSRMASHCTGYQHIDLSIKKRGWYSEENPYGWELHILHYPAEELDKWEQHWILEYTKQGYQCRYNKTAGGQGKGKEQINEYKPSKKYRDGVRQGYKNASKEVSNLFEKHLNYSKKSDKPNKNQDKAVEKFEEFLNYHKTVEEIEKERYGRVVSSGSE